MEIKGDDIPGILVALATLFTSVTAAIVSIVGLKKSSQNSEKIDDVRKLTDGLSSAAQKHAYDAGHLEGEAKARADTVAAAGAAALAREAGPPPADQRQADKPTGARIAATVVAGVEKVAEKSFDPLATAVADKVIEKTEKQP